MYFAQLTRQNLHVNILQIETVLNDNDFAYVSHKRNSSCVFFTSSIKICQRLHANALSFTVLNIHVITFY